MTRSGARWFLVPMLLLGGVGAVQALTELHQSVAGSGGLGSTGASHAIRSTLGQPVIAHAVAAAHVVHAGFWTPGTGVLSGAQGTDVLPVAFRLGAGVPNPFRQATLIRYDVPAPGGRVSIVLYDLTGRRVRTLAADHELPGFRSVRWDGRDDSGRPVAAGVYLCAMRAPGYAASRKLVLTTP